MHSRKRETLHVEKVEKAAQINDRTFEKRFALLDAETKESLVQVVQQLLDQKKEKFQVKIKNLQEALE